ncbi:MAG: outer membrane protein assembly factor [Puniceicoccaceae bacterium]
MKTRRWLIPLVASLLLASSLANAQTRIKVTGLGLFGNLDMERRLSFLSGAFEEEIYIMDARELEDSVYSILQQLKRDGHPNPVVKAAIAFADGRNVEHSWTLPFKSVARIESYRGGIDSVTFACTPGILNIYRSVDVTGVEALDPDTIEDYFLPSGSLFTRKADLAFTEGNLNRRVARLLTALKAKGYMDASETGREISRDPATGEVEVILEIEQGPIYFVGNQSIQVTEGTEPIDAQFESGQSGQIFNHEWLRRFRQKLLNEYYADGYPDARLFIERELTASPDQPDAVLVNLSCRIDRGQPAQLVAIEFEPEDLLKQSILRRTAEISVQQPFDLLAVEEGRRNLLSLGVLKDVDLEQRQVAPGERAVRYTMTPLDRMTLHLRAGWGSYERARVGLRWEHLNLWNRAHRYDLDVQVSTKSANADLTYVIPHFFDKRITAYARTGHEFREEISYDRTTTTFLVGATRRLERRDIELSVEYSVEIQDADRQVEKSIRSADQATVSSLTLRSIIDRRDSILYPTQGYDLSLESKSAFEALGGNANFQKLELTGSYHRPLWKALYLHLSLRYGGIYTRSPVADNLPFNERFFLGGENTVRGYQQGEASPRSPEGQLIGAEAYLLANVELEQRLFTNISVVAFWDGLAQSVERENIPDSEYLHSIGIGLRLRTPVGPIRLEYGHNLDPRPGDPEGTLHIAVGFPF